MNANHSNSQGSSTLIPLREDALSWLAERYCLGDLNTAERDTFESRLAVDQVARESLAAAVARLSAIHLVCQDEFAASPLALHDASPADSPKQINFWLHPSTWCSGIVLAMAFGAFLVTTSIWPSQEQRDAAAGNTLANAWSQTRDSASADTSGSFELAGDLIAYDEDALLASLATDEDAAPDWLIMAVSMSERASDRSEATAGQANEGEGA